MGYKLTVEGHFGQRALHAWLGQMRHVTVDLREHDRSPHRGETFTGQIIRVDMPGEPEPTITLVAVDLHGRPIDGGELRTVKVRYIAEVAVW